VNINYHIKNVILDGVSVEPHQVKIFMSAMEAAIRKQLSIYGVSNAIQSKSHHQTIAAERIFINNTSAPVSIGKAVGNSISRGIEE